MGKARIKCERIDQKMNKEMTSKFFEALTDLEKENNIGSDILIEKIKSGIEKAIFFIQNRSASSLSFT